VQRQMKIIIFLISLICYSCLTSSYIKKCLPGIEDIDILSVTQCRSYDPDGGYCCYLTYENEKQRVDVPIFLYDKKQDNKNNIRSLEPKNYCYGVSSEGYDNIEDVIEELSEETGVEELKIDCGKKGFKYNLLKGIILILIFILL